MLYKMRKLFLILSILICFSSFKYNSSSSSMIRNRRRHGGTSKISTKPNRRIISNNNSHHSIRTLPWTTEKYKRRISRPIHKSWSFKTHHNPRHAKVYFHRLRSKRKDKSLSQIYKRHIRGIRDTNRDEGLDEVMNINSSPTLAYDIIPTERETKKAADDFQQMRNLLQNIDKKISSLSSGSKHDSLKLQKPHRLIPSEVRRRQSNVVQSPLLDQMVETLKPNIPINEISRGVKQIPITPGDPLLEIFQILSLLPHNKESMDQQDQSTVNRMQANPLSNIAFPKGSMDPSYVKSVLNMSLQNMDQKQTLEFVTNALLNNNNFIEYLAKNMNYVNQSSTNKKPPNCIWYSGEFIVLITLAIFALCAAMIIIVWVFLDNSWIYSSSGKINFCGKGITKDTKKPEKKQSSGKQMQISEETESSLDMPHMSLKNMIRKSVVEDTHRAKKDATRDLIQRAGTEDYISVEGFKKWNNNWQPSHKKPSKGSIDIKRKSKIPKHRDPDLDSSEERMGQKKRIPKKSIAFRNESTTSGTLDDIVSGAINDVEGDPEIVISKDKVYENRNLNVSAVDMFR